LSTLRLRGESGEELAVNFLKKQKYKIIERNFQTRHGEIDIIARKANIIVFIEVKARASAEFAEPWEAVGFRKRKNVKAAAKIYLQQHPMPECDFRFDVISIIVENSAQPKIEWIQEAF